jgi:hypothetical protein
MLTLTDAQWRNLQLGEARQFVATICDGLLANRPELMERPGREVVLRRMYEAYDYAARTGFASTAHIVRLLYLSADAPRVHDDPLVDRYLRKPGATPEQRLDDLDGVLRHMLKEENT